MKLNLKFLMQPEGIIQNLEFQVLEQGRERNDWVGDQKQGGSKNCKLPINFKQFSFQRLLVKN